MQPHSAAGNRARDDHAQLMARVKDNTISGHGRRHSQAEDSVLLTPSNPNEREPSVSRCPKTPSRSPLTRQAARRGTRTDDSPVPPVRPPGRHHHLAERAPALFRHPALGRGHRPEHRRRASRPRGRFHHLEVLPQFTRPADQRAAAVIPSQLDGLRKKERLRELYIQHLPITVATGSLPSPRSSVRKLGLTKHRSCVAYRVRSYRLALAGLKTGESSLQEAELSGPGHGLVA